MLFSLIRFHGQKFRGKAVYFSITNLISLLKSYCTFLSERKVSRCRDKKTPKEICLFACPLSLEIAIVGILRPTPLAVPLIPLTWAGFGSEISRDKLHPLFKNFVKIEIWLAKRHHPSTHRFLIKFAKVKLLSGLGQISNHLHPAKRFLKNACCF